MVVYTGSACTWTATSNADWITITSTQSGAGNTAINFSVAPNSGPARTGTITLAGQTIAISQALGGSAALGFSTAATLPSGVADAPYSAIIAAAGGQPPYTFSGTAPSGFSLNSTTGALTSSSAPAGSYTFAITVKDAAGATSSRTFTLTVQSSTQPGGSGPQITNTFPAGTVGITYSLRLTTVGGCGTPFNPPTITVASGSLPPGLALANNQLTGTPTEAGPYSFILKATDPCGSSTKNVSLNVAAGTSGGGGSLVASPATVLFTAGLGIKPADQQVTINGPVGVSWSAAVSTTGNENWLRLASAGSGITGESVTLRAVPGTMALGSYDGLLNISSALGNVAVPVRLTIADSVTLTADTSSIEFDQHLPASSDKLQKTFKVDAASAVQFVASANVPNSATWLSVSPTQGSTPATITVGVNTAGIPAGEYNGSVSVAPANNLGPAVTIPVKLKITVPPTLTSSAAKLETSIKEGSTQPDQETITVSSSADPVKITAVGHHNRRRRLAIRHSCRRRHTDQPDRFD